MTSTGAVFLVRMPAFLGGLLLLGTLAVAVMCGQALAASTGTAATRPSASAYATFDPCSSDGDWYAFFDVPVPARPDPLPNGTRNQAVDLGDVLAVVFYAGTQDGDGGAPNGNGVAYDSEKMGVGTKAGWDYDRSSSPPPNPPWDAGPPDGAVSIQDVLAALAQVGLYCGDVWRPHPQTTWQWQLAGQLDLSVEAEMFDIDLFDNSASVVSTLHGQGRKVICYFSAGSWEDWRPDADDFPESVLGNNFDGWPGERWLDIRRLDVLGPIMGARLDLCRDKGFDGVEFDNVDGYENYTGFPLSYSDQIAYNTWLANAAHERGLSAGFKNDIGQAADLEPLFDFAIVEECFQYDECDEVLPFVAAGKAVFEVEYIGTLESFCPEANAMGFMAMKKRLSLDAWRQPCWD